MNPFVSQILGVGVRALVLWLAAKFGATLSDDQVVKIVAQVVPILAVLAWSVWQKYNGRQKLLTAAASPRALTEAQVEDKVNAGDAPSVLTPKNVRPS